MDLPSALLPLFTTFVHLLGSVEIDGAAFGLTGGFPQFRLFSRNWYFDCVVRLTSYFGSVPSPTLVVFD